MYCKKTSTKDLALIVLAAIKKAAQKCEDDVYVINIFLQEYEQQAGGGHPHYGVHCDTSWGGTSAAQQAVDAELPNDLYHLEYDEEKFEDADEAFRSALEEEWEKYEW